MALSRSAGEGLFIGFDLTALLCASGPTTAMVRNAHRGEAHRNNAATSPITRASGKKRLVAARFIHNDRLIDALIAQAFAALNASPGVRAFYDDLRARGIERNDALRRLANRLVGILHGCLKTRTSTTKPPPRATAKTSLNLLSRLHT